MQAEAISEVVAGAAMPRPREARPIICVGSGGIVRAAHLPAYRKAGFPVAALVDVDGERARTLAGEFEIPMATQSLADAIRHAGSDAVFDIAVPAGAIGKVLPLVPDGAAVLIQKPMGETLEEARAILALCRSKGLQAAVNFQLRWAPAMIAARRIADAGLLGQMHEMQVLVDVFTPWDLWTFLATAPRLEILYHSIHYIDLARAWLGNPARVLAKTVRNPRTPGLAATKSTILMDYGEWQRVLIATNHTNDFEGDQVSRVRWEGTEGAIEATMGVNLNYPVGRPDTLRFARRGEPWTDVAVAGNWFVDAFMGAMGSLQAYAAGETEELPTSVESAFETMRVVEAAYLSSEHDGTPLPD
ncbi:MAG: Gfo/Idh/MocA family protein [Acidobacteriota bacterium]